MCLTLGVNVNLPSLLKVIQKEVLCVPYAGVIRSFFGVILMGFRQKSVTIVVRFKNSESFNE